MRTQLLPGALAIAATSALIGLGAAPGTAQTPDPMKPGVTHERGILLECTGDLGARPVRVNLYENRTYGNYLEIQLGEGGGADEVGVSREFAKPFVAKGKVRATARLAGRTAAVRGTVVRTKKVTQIRDVVDDAGLRIVTKGTHTHLRDNLTFTYGKRSSGLDCQKAVIYRLKVTKTSIVD